jgi:hypothetical protein
MKAQFIQKRDKIELTAIRTQIQVPQALIQPQLACQPSHSSVYAGADFLTPGRYSRLGFATPG